jgi:hypothetical protein
MKTLLPIGAAMAISAVASALPRAAAAAGVPGYEQGRLSTMSQKSFENLRALTDQRIDEIRATPNMTLPWDAIVRYVSADGDDDANGMTPETAWKTLGKLTYNNLHPSSRSTVKYVLFRRGDIFRGTLKAVEGVTYSAYGEGPKPCIYSSPENGADPSKWTKAPGTDNVWYYHIGNSDVGTLVFDGGRAHAIKIVPKHHTNGVEFTQQYNGLSFTNGYKDLAFDLHFWHDYQKTSFEPHATGSGNLYLYSKGGQNPGERFRSIEFNVRKHGVSVGTSSNVHVDNLCIKYVGSHGIGAGTANGLKVTNCELGWIGGSIQYENEPSAVRFGNAVEIYGGCDDYVVSNCYVYQVYDAGITQQCTANHLVTNVIYQKGMRYTHNVVENCNYSIEYFLSRVPAENPSRMENFLIDNNIMWNSGYGYCQQRPDGTTGAHIKSWRNGCNRATGYVVRDNVFARGKEMLIEISSGLMNPDGSDSMPSLSDNVFIGSEGQRLGVVNQGTAVERKYDANGVAKLCENYAENTFLIYKEPRRKYSLSIVPPGPHKER